MTEAERFLHERLNSPKPNTPIAQSVALKGDAELPPMLGFLAHPVFSRHRIFWGIGFALMIALVDLLIMVATGAFDAIDSMRSLDDDHALALIVSFITPITFWIPLLVVARWVWNREFANELAWGATVWMAITHLWKIAALFTAYGISTDHILMGIVVFLIGALGIAAVVWNLVVNKHSQSPRQYRISIKCASCKKSFKQKVSAPDDYVICPRCGARKHLSELENFVKEPIVCQVIRAITYTLCFLAIIIDIEALWRALEYDSPIYLRILIACALRLALLFGIPYGIKKGMNWSRCLLFPFPGVLLYLPGCNAWFAVKTMLRKSHKVAENAKNAKAFL